MNFKCPIALKFFALTKIGIQEVGLQQRILLLVVSKVDYSFISLFRKNTHTLKWFKNMAWSKENKNNFR